MFFENELLLTTAVQQSHDMDMVGWSHIILQADQHIYL